MGNCSSQEDVLRPVEYPMMMAPKRQSSYLQTTMSNQTMVVDAPIILGDAQFEGPAQVKYVVGIDFGTTFTGFGVLKVPEGLEKVGTVHSYTDWPDQPPGFVSPKCPSVLHYELSRDGSTLPKLRQWGYSAKNSILGPYMRRCEHVKIAIAYEVAKKRGITMPDIAIKPKLPEGLSVVDVIADLLRQLYPLIIQTIQTIFTVDPPPKEALMYCFTLPVEWELDHQQVMRRAIFQAGLIDKLESDLLVFCHEPEAAAVSFFREYKGQCVPGSRALIVDCGGGTIDLFNCRIGQEGYIEEVSVAEGGLFGGSLVDEMFQRWLAQKIGHDAVEELLNDSFQRDTAASVFGSWDRMKRTFRLNELEWSTNDRVKRIRLFPSFTSIIDAEFIGNLEGGESLVITLEDMVSFFEPAVENIVKLVTNQMRLNTRPIDYLLLVGGFCGSPYLRSRILEHPAIKGRYGNCPVIQQPEGAVLRGATWYGYNQQLIRTRKAKKTLGIRAIRDFDPSKDLETEAVVVPHEGRLIRKAYKKFFPIVYKGTPIAVNTKPYVHHMKVYIPADSHIATANLELFITDIDYFDRIIDVTDPMCTKVGSLSMAIHSEVGNALIPISVSIEYGRIEIWVTLTNLKTKATVRTNITRDNTVVV